MMSTSLRLRAATSVIALCAMATAAHATEGYFQQGVSVRDKAAGGAGVAYSVDAMTLANNPAGLVDVGRQFNLGVSIFSPNRQFEASGPVPFVPVGTTKSDREFFLIPGMAYAAPIDATSSWGIAFYGNGGMNTTYRTNAAAGGCPTGGVFCSDKTGVDLNQAFLSIGYAKRFGNVSIGIAPVFAMQIFEAYGLGAFSGGSASPANLTNRGYDFSLGAGFRGGVQWHVTPQLAFGLSGATPMKMTTFSKYSGLFADHGSFDIPGNVTVGMAYSFTPAFTVMLDYKRIFYSGVGSVANASNIGQQFGTPGGPGFGWRDVDVVKLGAEWKASPALTLRAGYAHNTNPIQARDVTLNILAPGVVTDHISGGFSYATSRNSTIDFAAVYVPRASVNGVMALGGTPVPGTDIRLSMSQWEASLGWTYRWDAPRAALITKY